MAPYHVMLVHFPIALWTTAALIIILRAFSDGALARRADGALTLLLFLGALSGAAAFTAGLLIWPLEAVASSPLARNHVIFASWSLTYWTLLWLLRWRGGERVWIGLRRWVMVGLAALGFGLQTITGTLGGSLAGTPSAVTAIVRRVVWEVYTTFYLPNWLLILLVVAAALMIAIGFVGKRAPARQPR